MFRTKLITAMLIAVFAQGLFVNSLLASKDHTKLRSLRMEHEVHNEQVREQMENREWTAPEVELNVQARVPVVDAIGYLAMQYDQPQQLSSLVTKLRPIAKRVRELSGGEFRGTTFPADVEVQLDALRSQMMADVTAIYGANVTKQLEGFLKQKYAVLL